jgi:hypothetical protein
MKQAIAALVMGASLSAQSFSEQTPQPFPRPPSTSSGQSGSQPPRTEQPAPAAPQPAPPVQAARTAPADPNAPTEATLGLPLYPSAQLIASYDAGRGQRYYIFGSTASFAELVGYYKTVLKEGGDFVFKEPPTHMFEVGRFRDESMAFPPGVTIKDYTWAGSQGYPNPRRPANPERFPSIIMIVPAPAGQQ